MKRRRKLWCLAAGCSLSLTIVAGTSAGANPSIANPSAEVGVDGRPSNWSSYAWPQTTTVFTWADEGRTGDRSLRIDMSARSIGDAKWWTTPVEVVSGLPYAYSHWYRSSVSTQIMAEFRTSTGSATYQTLAMVPSRPDGWTQHTVTLTPPTGAVTVAMFHILPDVGWLMFDDVDLVSAPPPTTTTSTTSTTVVAPVGELAPNRSYEQSAGARPEAWVAIRSGANDIVLSHPADGGRTGSRLARASATEYTNGTGKWYFVPVPVEPGRPYRLSNWYRGSAASELMVEYRLSTGTSTYRWLGSVAPAADWTNVARSVTPPANAVALSFWQGITGVGTLDIDDVSLVLDTPPPPPPPPDGLIPNHSFEVAAGAGPAGWIPIRAGSNASTLTFPAAGGRTGSRYGRIETTAYTNGDAKWYFPPVPVTAGQTYRMTNWYRSDGATELMVEFRRSNGTSTYTYRGEVTPSSGAWAKRTQSITVPADAVSMGFWHSLRGIGYLDVDDFSLVPDSATAFQRPLLSLTFDDGFATNSSIVVPKLQQYSMTGTFYLAPGLLDTAGYLTSAEVSALAAAGMEIGAHTMTHRDLTTLTPSARLAELTDSKARLEALIGQPVTAFASPFGSYDPPTLIDVRATFSSHRTTNEGYNLRTRIDPYQIVRKGVFSTTTAADVTTWCQEATVQGGWLVLVYHELSANPGFFSTTPARFDEHLQALAECGIASVTVGAALTETLAQIP